jgi:hypothetical protein
VDFVVIGLGLSALALLTGLALLCLVAPHWFRKAGAAHPGDAAYARAQAGARRALGQGFLCGGAILLLSTLGGISAGLSDKSGAYLIASMATLVSLGLYGWDLLYRRQHPIPARRRPARATRVEPEARSAQPTAGPAIPHATTTKARRRVLPARQRVVPAEAPAVAVAAPVEVPHDENMVQSDQREPVVSSEPQATHSDQAEPLSPDPECETDLAALDATTAEAPENVQQEEAADAPDADAPELPEPGTLATAASNGATEPETLAPSVAEPEVLPNGDDRVIALFPTAAAQRSRTVIAPPDSNGQR